MFSSPQVKILVSISPDLLKRRLFQTNFIIFYDKGIVLKGGGIFINYI